VALQLLYQHELNPHVGEDTVRLFMRRRLGSEDLEQFCDRLYRGTLRHLADIDRLLAQVAENWSVERMALVDRNILRLGVYELLYEQETPPRVAIDEAIELAKRYGSAESAAFVNGILDRLAAHRLGSPPDQPVEKPDRPTPGTSGSGSGPTAS